MSDRIMLKIGGSVITKKDENLREANTETIRRIAKEIKLAKEKSDFKLILVHGAGPFGHKLVTDYGIKDGLKTKKHMEGFVRTHNSMEDLNKIIVDVFREEGLLGFPIQPSACIIQDNKKIIKFDSGTIKELLNLDSDIIPILYGDVVIDKSLGGSVVSGDAILAYLAKELEASKVLIGTDVDGIFTADPKLDKNAELLEEITAENLDNVLKRVKGATTVDVTGGMEGKILEIKENLSGIETWIFNLNKENNLEDILSGVEIKRTKILL